MNWLELVLLLKSQIPSYNFVLKAHWVRVYHNTRPNDSRGDIYYSGIHIEQSFSVSLQFLGYI